MTCQLAGTWQEQVGTSHVIESCSGNFIISQSNQVANRQCSDTCFDLFDLLLQSQELEEEDLFAK